MEPPTLKRVRRVQRQDFPMGRPRRVSPGAKSLFSDGLASARSCLSSSRAETPKLVVRLFLPLGVLLRAFGTPSCSVPEASKKPVSVGESPRGPYIYIKAISGDCLPPNPAMGTEIEISPWIKPVEIRVFVMEACVQCCGVVEAQRQERLGRRSPGDQHRAKNAKTAKRSDRCRPSNRSAATPPRCPAKPSCCHSIGFFPLHPNCPKAMADA